MSTPSQNGGGGLFGGSIQAPGEFNFSAPAQGLNLPTPTFGPRSNAMNTQSADVLEKEGRFAGDDRSTKRQFGAPSTVPPSNSVSQPSNPFGQSQPSNPFGSTQQASGGNIFSFGASQQSGASGINFSSGSTTPANPADNPFSFQPTSQPTPSTPSTSFGSGPFNFNQQSAQAQNRPGKYDFTVGATTPYSLAPALQQDKPASSPFLFGQTSGQPSSSGLNFSSAPATAPSASNPFGSATTTTSASPASSLFGSTPTITTAPPTSNIFGSTPTTVAPQDKPASSPFSFGQTSGQSSSSGINFGSNPAIAPPLSNLFGSIQPQQPAQSTNSFGSSNQQSSSSSNPFAHLNVQASPASNVFGKQEQNVAAPAASNAFGAQHPLQVPTTNNFFRGSTQTSTTSSTSNLFGQKPPSSPSTNMFGNLNKPTSNTESDNQNVHAPAGSMFGNKESKSTNDLFGNLNKPVDQSVTQQKDDSRASENGTNTGSSLFGKSAPAVNIFGASKSVVSLPILFIDICKDDTNSLKFPASPARQSEPAMNGTKPAISFGSIQSTTPQTSGNMFSPLKPIDAPSSASQPPPTGMFPSLDQAKSPQKLNESSFIPASIAAAPSDRPSQGEALQREMTSVRQQMKEATGMTDESMAHLVPAQFSDFQKRKFFVGYRMRTLNNAMAKLFTIISHDEDVTSDIEFYNEQRGSIMADSLTLKRKIGEEENERVDHANKRSKQSIQSISTDSPEQQSKRKLGDEEDQENENPSKRTRQIEPSDSAPALANGEVKSNGQTSTPTNGNNFQPWKAPSLGLASTSETPLKRKADDQITKDSVQRSPLRPMKTPKTNGTVESGLSGSTTSNLFRNILDSPSKSPGKNSLEKKVAALPEPSKDDRPRTNPFQNLPGVSPSNKPTPVPSSIIFGTNAIPATSTVPSQNLFASKVTLETPNIFTQKATAPSTPTGSVVFEQKSNALKPPTFNGATNFLEQFNQKAEEAEKKALQKAIDEEYDSDDDLEEFKANFKAKQLATRKAIEESAKNSKGFKLAQTPPTSATGSSSSQAGSNQAKITSEPLGAGAGADSSTGQKPLFGQNASSQASGNSVFSSLNGSRTPTPGPLGSSTGSVLDGHTPAKPINFNNIFSHLSDADSGKGDDADDESGDELSDPEEDSEKKDPTYQPDGENAGGPGTPVEETGAGMASVKKTNSFTFGPSKFASASPSGTSSPGGSLFDRITKDSNGNIVRHISTEEKENTQPSTANLFSDIKNTFNKSTGPAGDNTWKPDSPIRFGSATSHKDDQDSAPIVSITAATPTKTGSPSSIFGGMSNTTGSAPKPLSSLFGNIGGESKPASSFSSIFGTPSNAMSSTPGNVGFAFGASSTTSSLFPSAAASATTSRATTPGGTTDGDNSGDGGAETEHHEQIDLTAGGPGEEDEEVVHEVRAKALKFSPKENGDNSNQWETKGVGPLRVLKHKETGVSRILLRADPRGTIVLNKGLLSGIKYEAAKKTVKFLTREDHGTGLETWILQVKTPESANALAEVLEASKAT
jgi:hypothetical protein